MLISKHMQSPFPVIKPLATKASSVFLSGIFVIVHPLTIWTQCTVRRRHSHRGRVGDDGKHLLVLSSKGTIHDTIYDWVDRTARVPQTSGNQENLK